MAIYQSSELGLLLVEKSLENEQAIKAMCSKIKRSQPAAAPTEPVIKRNIAMATVNAGAAAGCDLLLYQAEAGNG